MVCFVPSVCLSVSKSCQRCDCSELGTVRNWVDHCTCAEIYKKMTIAFTYIPCTASTTIQCLASRRQFSQNEIRIIIGDLGLLRWLVEKTFIRRFRRKPIKSENQLFENESRRNGFVKCLLIGFIQPILTNRKRLIKLPLYIGQSKNNFSWNLRFDLFLETMKGLAPVGFNVRSHVAECFYISYAISLQFYQW